MTSYITECISLTQLSKNKFSHFIKLLDSNIEESNRIKRLEKVAIITNKNNKYPPNLEIK